MYAVGISGPMSLGESIGLREEEINTLVSATLMMSGLGTFMQTVDIHGKIGAKLPIVEGVSFAGVSALLAVSCKNDIEISEISTPDKFVAPIIGSCGNVIVNATNSNAESVIFTWTPADFGQPLQVLYLVDLQAGDDTTMMGTSFFNSFAIIKGD